MPARCTSDFWNGSRPAFSSRCGRLAWRSTTRWRALLGDGRALTAPCSRRRWRKKVPVPTQRIGGKKGSKRHLLVDGRGVPLSLVVTGANVHDSKGLELVLDAIVVKRPNPPRRRSKHLCADAAYTGTKHAQTMQRGLSGFLCVRRLGDLALGHFLDCFQAPARPPEAPRLSHVLMVQPPHLPACAGSVNRSS